MALSSLIMDRETSQFSSVADMLRTWRPSEPVYCVYPDKYLETAKHFLRGFPGRVLYAVKANDDPRVLQLLNQAGIAHFDCASLHEIDTVRAHCPDARCYFMVPVGQRGEAAKAQREHGVRHFMIDHSSRLESLGKEIEMPSSVVFARMAVSHDSAMMDLSAKFGAPPAEIPGLLARIRDTGAEPALAFNVGTLVTRPEAYTHAIGEAARVLQRLPYRLRLIDIGGGFPRPYPGFPVPPLDEFIASVGEAARLLPMSEDGELLAEPGRALAASGLSAVVEVLLRKNDRLYINDGMYGVFWELRFKGQDRFPVRAYRGGDLLNGRTASFALYGPTCDASDMLPGRVELPGDIRAGDHLEFDDVGAYSLSGRTRFNGYYSDRIIQISPRKKS